jgi:AAA-like domain
MTTTEESRQLAAPSDLLGTPEEPAGGRSRPRGRLRQRNRDYRPARLRLRSVDGFITRTATSTMAWFVEPPVAWSMRTTAVREARLAARAQRLVELAELGITEIHQRVVRRPWPVQQWARAHTEWAHSSASKPPPDVPGALSWDDLLAGDQRAQFGRALTAKTVYWGIELSGRTALAQTLESVVPRLSWAGRFTTGLSRSMDSVLDRELGDLRSELRSLCGVMAASGLQATPATADEMQWLLMHSAALGLPLLPESAPSDHWDLSDLAALVDAAQIDAEPRTGCVRVSGLVHGQYVVRYVAILTAGRMGEMVIPEVSLPWQVWGDSLGFPVEQSARIRFPGEDVVRRSMDRQMNRIASQVHHYTIEHDKEPPPDLREKAERANEIATEVQNDHTGLATRTEGWYRWAVTGTTEDEVLDRAARLQKTYSPTIRLEHVDGQYQQYREFTPGERLSSPAHRRRMSVRVAAAGLPSVTDRLGDRHGPHIAETVTLSRRPVNWDMWYAPEVLDRSGLTPVIGGLGSGKTHLCGMLVYRAVRSGASGIVLDPSGPLRRLAALPELAPFTHLVDLMNARPGTLNPYRVITEPLRSDYPAGATGDEEYSSEVRSVAAERRVFVADILSQLLDPRIRERAGAHDAMTHATAMVGGSSDNEPGMVIEALRVIAGERPAPSQAWAASARVVTADERASAAAIARELDQLRDLREVRLLFPQPGIDPGWGDRGDIRLTILTMPGLQLPNLETVRTDWTIKERLGVPLVHLASWLTHRLIYETPRNIRKIVFLDEARYLSGHGAAAMLFVRLERDTRKFDVRALVASQLASDFLALPGYESLTHEVIVGSVEGRQAQADALRLLRLDNDHGWNEVIGGLNSAGGTIEDSHDPDVRAVSARLRSGPREYVMKIGADTEIVRVDYSKFPHLAHVAAALDSSPTGRESIVAARR